MGSAYRRLSMPPMVISPPKSAFGSLFVGNEWNSEERLPIQPKWENGLLHFLLRNHLLEDGLDSENGNLRECHPKNAVKSGRNKGQAGLASNVMNWIIASSFITSQPRQIPGLRHKCPPHKQCPEICVSKWQIFFYLRLRDESFHGAGTVLDLHFASIFFVAWRLCAVVFVMQQACSNDEWDE